MLVMCLSLTVNKFIRNIQIKLRQQLVDLCETRQAVYLGSET